jgi:hypothetical protein
MIHADHTSYSCMSCTYGANCCQQITCRQLFSVQAVQCATSTASWFCTTSEWAVHPFGQHLHVTHTTKKKLLGGRECGSFPLHLLDSSPTVAYVRAPQPHLNDAESPCWATLHAISEEFSHHWASIPFDLLYAPVRIGARVCVLVSPIILELHPTTRAVGGNRLSRSNSHVPAHVP